MLRKGVGFLRNLPYRGSGIASLIGKTHLRPNVVGQAVRKNVRHAVLEGRRSGSTRSIHAARALTSSSVTPGDIGCRLWPAPSRGVVRLGRVAQAQSIRGLWSEDQAVSGCGGDVHGGVVLRQGPAPLRLPVAHAPRRRTAERSPLAHPVNNARLAAPSP